MLKERDKDQQRQRWDVCMSLLSKLVQYPKHTVCVGVLQKAGELEQYRMRFRALNTAVSHANRFALYCELNGGKMQ